MIKPGTVKEKNKNTKTPLKIPFEVEPLRDLVNLDKTNVCELVQDKMNQIVESECKKKEFVADSSRPCLKETSKNSKTDLVIIIDTSGSMNDESQDLSNAAQTAIDNAKNNCNSDLKVTWLGIEGTFQNTKFDQTIRNYLNSIGIQDSPLTATNSEDGAPSIVDIATHFDWRSGASKAVFFLGDEALKGGDPHNQIDIDAASTAIQVANSKGVKVFTYFGTPGNPSTAAIVSSEFERVATDTGGKAYKNPIVNIGGFQQVLEEIICKSSTEGCRPIKIPDILPCFELKWGDSKHDRIETEDFEVLCITACNPYSNVVLKNVTILAIIVTDENNNPVANLPDGTHSIIVLPRTSICFGDLQPCNSGKSDKMTSCVTREIILKSSGALEGKYHINIGFCNSAEFMMRGIDKFKINLVKS